MKYRDLTRKFTKLILPAALAVLACPGGRLFAAPPEDSFPHRIASYTTWYESGSARAQNIALAAARLDGLILQPGAEFSFNESVTWRIPRASLAWAPALIDGEPVLSPGGGLCQVSSTLYAAALHAGLEIIGRRPHSSAVDYITPGLDATVSTSSGVDLLLGQDLPFPVLLEAEAERGVLRVSLRARQEPGFRVTVVTEESLVEGRWLETVVERTFHETAGESVTMVVSRDRYLVPVTPGMEGEP